jgi:SAM-dependent methyltransferase
MPSETERFEHRTGPSVRVHNERGEELASLNIHPTDGGDAERGGAHAAAVAGPDQTLRVEPRAFDRVLAVLRCPRCGAPVAREADGLRCSSGHGVPVRRGYIDASGDTVVDDATARTFESFGYEWTTFSEVREEDEEYADQHYLRDLDTTQLHGKVGLDAGCGRGRYTRFLAPHLSAVVALDGSDAVQSAARNLADLPNAVVVRSDLREAPFEDEAFGFIASFGVLHHLTDPRAGFDRLVELLAPGGVMSLYLYSRPDGRGVRSTALAASAAMRRLTLRMSHPRLKAICTPIAMLLWAGVILPGMVGDMLHVERLSALPMASYRDKPFRNVVADTFDRLSAPIEHRYTWPDLAPWFEEAGLVVDSHRDNSGWFVVAHRPG